MLRLSPTLLLAATFLVMMRDVSSERVVTCADTKNVHRLSCAHGVISVQKALYGRADAETCSEGRPPQQLTDTKCSLEGTLERLRERCNDYRECEVNIEDIQTSDPCYGTYKYLETSYTCLGPNELSVCEHSSADLSCDEGQVISIFVAVYGRSDKTTCAHQRPDTQVQNVDCAGPMSQGVVAESCNGKNSCTVTASNEVFGDPCHGTYKYLDIVYLCEYSG